MDTRSMARPDSDAVALIMQTRSGRWDGEEKIYGATADVPTYMIY